MGFEVRDDQGALWGVVTAVLEQPLNPLLEVTADPGANPILIPFTPAIIHEIGSPIRSSSSILRPVSGN